MFKIEGSARLVVQFEGELPEAAPCITYAQVDLDGQVGIVVDVTPDLYEFVRLVVPLAGCFYTEYGDGLRHSLIEYPHHRQEKILSEMSSKTYIKGRHIGTEENPRRRQKTPEDVGILQKTKGREITYFNIACSYRRV